MSIVLSMVATGFLYLALWWALRQILNPNDYADRVFAFTLIVSPVWAEVLYKSFSSLL